MATAWATRDPARLDQAIADCDHALRLNPRYAPAYRYRGAAWADKGDHAKAIADDTQALRLEPTDVGTYIARGQCARAPGREYGDQAIADCDERALQRGPLRTTACTSIGAHAYFAKGQWEMAITDLTAALEARRQK